MVEREPDSLIEYKFSQIQSDIKELSERVSRFTDKIENNYSTKADLERLGRELETVKREYVKVETFKPIYKGAGIIFGLILTAFVTALISLVIIR